MVAGVEECRHAITILCFSVNPNLRLKQGGNNLGMSSTSGKHERGERGWSHVQRGAALLHLHTYTTFFEHNGMVKVFFISELY